jgi:hypothetical protein
MKAVRRSILGTGIFALLLGATPAFAQTLINGFGNGAGFTLNSNGALPTISGGALTITTNSGDEARSVFYDTPVAAAPFTAQFIYQASGSKDADGITFVIENDPRGVNAIGGLGSGLGYGNSDGDNSGAWIHSSVAVEMNLFNGHTRGTNVQTGGTVTDPYTGNYNLTGSVLFNSGDQIQVNVGYNGTLLTTTFLDLSTSQSYQASYSVNLASVLGGSTGYVGFTGGTGSQVSIQTISNFTFASIPEPSSVVLLGLGIAGIAVGGRRRMAEFFSRG